jgi:hypothetical protein
MAYLDSHPPARSQFRCPRRAKPSGVVVVHTAENVMDTVGPDTGAEAVARFIQGRDTPGSYHDLVDSDSILDLVRYECEAFQDGTGSNPHAYALSAACSYLDWAKMSKAKRDAFVENMAQAVARYARWVKKTHGVTIPARRITRDQSTAGVPGFVSHAERDPARRKDPGNASGQFPWSQFLARFAALMAPATTPSEEDDDMPKPFLFRLGAKSPTVLYQSADREIRHVPKGSLAGYKVQQKMDGASPDVCVLATRNADGTWTHPDANILAWTQAIVAMPFVGPMPGGWDAWWVGPHFPGS